MPLKEKEIEAFRRLAETWGGDLRRWPEAERAWAEAMAQDAEAAEILAEARRFDARIESHPTVSEARAASVAGAVMGRVAQEAVKEAINGAVAWWTPLARALFTPSGAPSLGAYACIAIGVIAGAALGAAAPIGGGAAEQELAMQIFVGQDAVSLQGMIR